MCDLSGLPHSEDRMSAPWLITTTNGQLKTTFEGRSCSFHPRVSIGLGQPFASGKEGGAIEVR